MDGSDDTWSSIEESKYRRSLYENDNCKTTVFLGHVNRRETIDYVAMTLAVFSVITVAHM